MALAIGCVIPRAEHVQTEPGTYFITAEAGSLMRTGQRWHERAAEICREPGYRVLNVEESRVPFGLGGFRTTMEGYVTCNPPESP